MFLFYYIIDIIFLKSENRFLNILLLKNTFIIIFNKIKFIIFYYKF